MPTCPRAGLTLIEMLVSVGLTVLLMAILAQVFTVVAGTMTLQRTLREVDQRVRSAQTVLRNDLDGVTVVMAPPRDPADGEGYFEYEENTTVVEWDLWRDNTQVPREVTGADTDDVIQFTTRIGRGKHRPFVGRGAGGTEESQVAEVAYFLRESRPRSGTTPVLYNLYRRQLLVEAEQPLPVLPPTGNFNPDASWHWQYDLSARPNRPGVSLTDPVLAPNGLPEVNRLGDLTLRENRFAHDPLLDPTVPNPRWPHLPISFEDVNLNGIYDPGDVILAAPFRITWFGRPLLRETADADWDSPRFFPSANVPYLGPVDMNNDGLMEGNGGVAFTTPLPNLLSPGDQPRFAEDVLLTNVLSFNVEAWDPGAPVFETIDIATGRRLALVEPGHPQYTLLQDVPEVQITGFGAYVDLGYGLAPWLQTFGNPRFVDTFPIAPSFWHRGDRRTPLFRTYDTWANYGHDGVDNDPPPVGLAAETSSPQEPFNLRLVADGIDNDGNGWIDERIDDGFNFFDDDDDQAFWQSDGLDNDGDGLGWDADMNGTLDPDEIDPDEGINETYVTAGPGYDDWIDNDGANNGGAVPLNILDPRELFEAEAPPPYPVPLRGIRIRIRVFEPKSQRTREFTLIHSFRTE